MSLPALDSFHAMHGTTLSSFSEKACSIANSTVEKVKSATQSFFDTVAATIKIPVVVVKNFFEYSPSYFELLTLSFIVIPYTKLAYSDGKECGYNLSLSKGLEFINDNTFSKETLYSAWEQVKNTTWSNREWKDYLPYNLMKTLYDASRANIARFLDAQALQKKIFQFASSTDFDFLKKKVETILDSENIPDEQVNTIMEKLASTLKNDLKNYADELIKRVPSQASTIEGCFQELDKSLTNIEDIDGLEATFEEFKKCIPKEIQKGSEAEGSFYNSLFSFYDDIRMKHLQYTEAKAEGYCDKFAADSLYVVYGLMLVGALTATRLAFRLASHMLSKPNKESKTAIIQNVISRPLDKESLDAITKTSVQNAMLQQALLDAENDMQAANNVIKKQHERLQGMEHIVNNLKIPPRG